MVAWLLALIAVVLGVAVGGKRLFGYAAALIATAAVAVMVDTPFGWPLLVSGVVITLVGWAMMRRFVNSHPRIETL
jgi:Flp pilus assembly protein TadB